LRVQSPIQLSLPANHPVRASIPLPLLALEDMLFIDGMMERLYERTRQKRIPDRG